MTFKTFMKAVVDTFPIDHGLQILDFRMYDLNFNGVVNRRELTRMSSVGELAHSMYVNR